jgi:ABC-2 type transport system permease protein
MSQNIADPTPASPGFFAPALTLANRELVRFFRQRNRVVGALLQPVIFYVFLGAAFNASFKIPGMPDNFTYQEYFFPGTIVMILMFTAIFSTISIIEDRREGFLQSVLVAPASRFSMVMGKLLGGTALALIQGMLFMLAGLFLNIPFSIAIVAEAAGVMALVSLALCGLGFLIAWRMESSQGFHAIMSVFLFPMLLLSGAFYPSEGTPVWMRWIMELNPLTYGLAALRHVLYGAKAPAFLPGFEISMAITALFAVATVMGSVWISGTRTTGDLQ